jgi:hypothetical protein
MAIEREATAKAQIKLRLRETLRADLAEQAKQNECSLNTEIVMRLQNSLRDEQRGEATFGSRNIFILVSLVARLIKTLENKRGKKVCEDVDIFPVALNGAKLFWQVMLDECSSAVSADTIEAIDILNLNDQIIAALQEATSNKSAEYA